MENNVKLPAFRVGCGYDVHKLVPERKLILCGVEVPYELLLETMDYDAKNSAGKVLQEEAREKAYSEYKKYKVIQDRSYISDFDRFNSGNDDDTPLLPFDIEPKE